MLKDYRFLPEKMTDEIEKELLKLNCFLCNKSIYFVEKNEYLYKEEYRSITISTTGVYTGGIPVHFVKIKVINYFYKEIIPKLLELGIIEEVE